MPVRASCRGKKKPTRRPWHKKPCPPPVPNPCPAPTPGPAPPPRSQKPQWAEGRGRCWTCAFWEGPLQDRPNLGTCEATVMLKDGSHPFERSQAKVELDAGRACQNGRYILVTLRMFGCAQWMRG